MEIIDQELLNSISKKAEVSSRLRMNYNFHPDINSKAQRLLNALEPGTDIPIHRHQDTSETYILIKGSIKVMQYNDNLDLILTTELNPKKGIYGVDIPAGEWHTIEVLESGTVIFEVKEGPYQPLTSKNILIND